MKKELANIFRKTRPKPLKLAKCRECLGEFLWAVEDGLCYNCDTSIIKPEPPAWLDERSRETFISIFGSNKVSLT